MDAAELKSFTDSELQEKLVEIRESMGRMKFQNVTSGLESPIELRNLRRNIARVMTEINGRKK